MTPEQVKNIKESWALVGNIDPLVVGEIFYNRLFEMNPELRFMFRNPMPEQSRKLLAMLGYIISRLDRLEELVEEIQRLAQSHVKYGVKEMHYSLVGAALLYTLEKGLGNAWNAELQEAWTDCYGILSTAMINASQEIKAA